MTITQSGLTTLLSVLCGGKAEQRANADIKYKGKKLLGTCVFGISLQCESFAVWPPAPLHTLELF